MRIGILSSIAHWSTKSQGNGCFPRLPYLNGAGGLNRGLQSDMWGTGPTDLSFKCIKVQDCTLVQLAKVILPVNNLICCFNIPLFFSMFLSCLWVIKERRPPFNVMFFCWVLHIMSFEMRSTITVDSTKISAHGIHLPNPLIVAAQFVQETDKGKLGLSQD